MSFDSLLAELDDQAVRELSWAVGGGLVAFDHDLCWQLRTDPTEIVRTLTTVNLDTILVPDTANLERFDSLALEQLTGAGDCEVRELQIWRFYKLVETVTDPTRELSVEEGRARFIAEGGFEEDCVVGEELGFLERDESRKLRVEFLQAINRQLQVTWVDEASEGEANIAGYLDALATERSRADVATELAGRDLFWRWNVRQPAWEMSDAQRKQFCRFCVAVFHRSGAAFNDPLGRVLMHPDLATVRGLVRWLQRHRRRDHFGGRRR